MKKLLFLLVIGASIATQVISQTTTPRFGITVGADNTGRTVTYKYKAITDVAGADSIAVAPGAWQTLYKVTLTDSFTFKQPVVTNCYFGDQITIIASAASGTPKLKFTGSKWKTAGTATLSTGLRAVIDLVFDGAAWVERSRVVQ
jgi:hypothetical protein